MQPASTRPAATNNPTATPLPPSDPPAPAGAEERVFIARQPIFEAQQQRAQLAVVLDHQHFDSVRHAATLAGRHGHPKCAASSAACRDSR